MSELHSRLQQVLEVIYRVDGPARVADFCMGQDHIDALFGANASRYQREALLIDPSRVEDEDEVGLGLYVDDQIVAEAEQFAQTARHPSGIDSFCVAVEGVSHFLYLTYCGAALERPVSKIELELQAEVDKYVLLRILFDVPALVDRLFYRIRIDHGLSHAEQERYVVANQNAARYARWIERAFARGDGAHALADARRLYRKPLTCKLEHIARAA